MSRRNFYEILNGSPYNVKASYKRIYDLFFNGTHLEIPINDVVDEVFEMLPDFLRGRAISLSDFNETYGFSFAESNMSVEVDDLISLCEYVWNLCKGTITYAYPAIDGNDYENIEHMLKMIEACVEDLSHSPLKKDNIIIFVPKNPDVVATSEIVQKDIAVNILEYHHHGLRGDLSKKKAILKTMADDIECERLKLRSINKNLEAQLFQLLNKFIRHDQAKTPFIATMKPSEIEKCYDDIYQMWLLARLEIEHYTERKERVASLLEKING